ncbi:hypothetical protein QQF64_025701, partial [Cirrhinus molitorella]
SSVAAFGVSSPTVPLPQLRCCLQISVLQCGRDVRIDTAAAEQSRIYEPFIKNSSLNELGRIRLWLNSAATSGHTCYYHSAKDGCSSKLFAQSSALHQLRGKSPDPAAHTGDQCW